MKGLIFKEQGCSLNMFASRKSLGKKKKKKVGKKKNRKNKGKENKNVLIQKTVPQRQKAHGTNLVTSLIFLTIEMKKL